MNSYLGKRVRDDLAPTKELRCQLFFQFDKTLLLRYA
jgi:hypothetical protein